jgi:hypothetical protein
LVDKPPSRFDERPRTIRGRSSRSWQVAIGGGTENDRDVDLRLPGIILAVTGLIALIVSLTKGPNLGISRRTGVTVGAVLLVLGAVLLVYVAVSS